MARHSSPRPTPTAASAPLSAPRGSRRPRRVRRAGARGRRRPRTVRRRTPLPSGPRSPPNPGSGRAPRPAASPTTAGPRTSSAAPDAPPHCRRGRRRPAPRLVPSRSRARPATSCPAPGRPAPRPRRPVGATPRAGRAHRPPRRHRGRGGRDRHRGPRARHRRGRADRRDAGRPRAVLGESPRSRRDRTRRGHDRRPGRRARRRPGRRAARRVARQGPQGRRRGGRPGRRAPKFVKPAEGRFTSGFGARWGTSHKGVDIANAIGTPIKSVANGTVIDSGPASGFGMWVRVQLDDGTINVYGHVNRSYVTEGQKVKAGQEIAEIGNRGESTGPAPALRGLDAGRYEDQPAAVAHRARDLPWAPPRTDRSRRDDPVGRGTGRRRDGGADLRGARWPVSRRHRRGPP